MGKNRKYRDYTNYGQTEEKNEPIETVVEEEDELVDEDQELDEIVDTIKAVRETAEEKSDGVTYDYTQKEEVNTKGLDENTFESGHPHGKIKADKLRIRTSPSSANNNNILGIYDKGTVVTILKEEDGWMTVELEKNSNKVRGFAMAKFIERILRHG